MTVVIPQVTLSCNLFLLSVGGTHVLLTYRIWQNC